MLYLSNAQLKIKKLGVDSFSRYMRKLNFNYFKLKQENWLLLTANFLFEKKFSQGAGGIEMTRIRLSLKREKKVPRPMKPSSPNP